MVGNVRDHLFPVLLRLQEQLLLHLPSFLPSLQHLSLSFQHKLSWLYLSQSIQEKRQKLGLQKFGNAVGVIGKLLFADCIQRREGKGRGGEAGLTHFYLYTKDSFHNTTFHKSIASPNILLYLGLPG